VCPEEGCKHKSNLALLRAGITDRESYLRVRDSLLKISQAKSRDDQGKAQEIAIKQAAAALKGIPGFYPTHPELADIVVERLQLIPGERVLESSAGAGHIAEAVRRAGAEPDVIERNDDLRAILELKGFQVVGRDFLNFTPQQPYDAVAQNPPFENSADIDHIRHAFEVVRPGGRVSSIASESTFVGESKKQKDFRNWLNELGAKIEVLPADSFLKLKPSTPFRARLISFRKPSKADAAEFPPLQDLLPSIEAEVVTLLNDREPISLLISVDGRAPVEYRLSPLDSGLYAISRGTEPTLTRAPGELAEIISALGEVIGTRGGRPLVVRAELASDPGALAPSVATQSAEGVQSTSVAAWKNIAPDTAGVFRASRGPAVLTITRGQEPAGLRASVALDGESYDLPYDYKLKYGVGGGAPAARLEAAERALWEFAGALLAARQDQAAPAGSESVDPELDFIAALREASNV
jgi:predicted RNA methylase